jgi:hypothetical protein
MQLEYPAAADRCRVVLRLSLCVLVAACAGGRPKRATAIENTVRGAVSPTCMSMSFAGDRTLTLRLATDDNEFGVSVFEPNDGVVFPAASSDGTILVDLFDEANSNGAPASSLVFWSTRTGQRMDVFRPGLNDQTTLDTTNARLARSRWRGVATCTPHGDGETSLDTAFGRIELRADRRELRLGDTRVQLALPGVAPRSHGERCGSYGSIERAYGVGALVIVTLQATIAGDDCSGLPSSDLAVAVMR